ncbi:MAG: RHS repeat-associated core domain-containing protein [Gammaproteobacteria bacterium]
MGEQRQTTYIYDAIGRLVQETQPDGTILVYGYDLNGNKISLTVTLSDGREQPTTYTYDALNRLDTVSNETGVTGYGYDAVGNCTHVMNSNGSSQVYRYDELNRLTRLETYDGSGVLVAQYDYTLDATGRRTGMAEQDGWDTHYTYDPLYRLTTEIITDPNKPMYQASYTYDAVGNRIQGVIDGVTTAYTYDANDRLLQQGGTQYSYDANGNLLSTTLDGLTTEYVYDSKNKLISADTADGALAFSYNADGIRTGKTRAGVATQYVVDSNRDYAQVLVEKTGTDEVVYTFGDNLVSQDRNGAVNFYHYDGLGSTRALSDASGSLTDTYDYEAFGEVLTQTGATVNSYLFTGEQFDQDLDQYYLRARYYNQATGRFTQQDTWMGVDSDPITLNKYVYANADPVNWTDPTGNFSIGSAMSAIGNFARLATTATINVGRAVAGRVNGTSIRNVASLRTRLWLN